MHKTRKLDRILRVRTLQLGQVRSHEAAARAKVEQEEALRERIAQLSANVAPVAQASEFATGLIAAAHYRERLQQSAQAAERRVAVAEQGLDAATEATREAKRDQSAVEKLIAREAAEAAVKAIRALETLPPTGKNRHDLC
jgi:flagellar protein FliJ